MLSSYTSLLFQWESEQTCIIFGPNFVKNLLCPPFYRARPLTYESHWRRAFPFKFPVTNQNHSFTSLNQSNGSFFSKTASREITTSNKNQDGVGLLGSFHGRGKYLLYHSIEYFSTMKRGYVLLDMDCAI